MALAPERGELTGHLQILYTDPERWIASSTLVWSKYDVAERGVVEFDTDF
jgi:hypothetical protein